jgi:hypothetical protein
MSNNPSTMEAGPEMDRLINEQVMGWEVRSTGMGDGSFYIVIGGDEVNTRRGDDFRPSTDIAHAWEVVDHLNELGWEVEVLSWQTCRPERWTWSAMAQHRDRQQSTQRQRADTAPLAICRAALLAVQQKVTP